jgi:hypothetical protein
MTGFDQSAILAPALNLDRVRAALRNVCWDAMVDEEVLTRALSAPSTDFSGRSMRSMVFVEEDGISEDEDLEEWLQRGMGFAGSLPPK